MLQPRQFNDNTTDNGLGSPPFRPDNSTSPTSPTSSQTNRDSSTLSVAVIGSVIAVIAILVLVVTSYAVVRHLRITNKQPTLIPGSYLKRKYRRWHPLRKYKPMDTLEEARTNTPDVSMEYRGHEETPISMPAISTVDRHNSVRSVMTLPSYSQDPRNTEKVLGREGERAGMDTVIEHPETAEQEEATREAEMESLYQIRLARRQEVTEHEQRRQERRRARERGDWARLEELRRESRQRAQAAARGNRSVDSDILIAEHQSRPKDRRVSSVAYAEIGHVTHDGRRLRANSSESDRVRLLDSVSLTGSTRYHRNNSEGSSLFTVSNLSRSTLPITTRERSDSGARSLASTVSSVDSHSPIPMITVENTSSFNSAEDHHHTPDSHSEHLAETAVVGTQHHDSLPPDYDNIDWGDAPAYTEAEIRRRESQRQQALGLTLPTITVQGTSEPNTPAIGRISEETARFQ